MELSPVFFECFNCKCFQTTKTFSLLNDREERERGKEIRNRSCGKEDFKQQ